MASLVRYPEGTILQQISTGERVTVGPSASERYNPDKFSVIKMGTGSTTSSAPSASSSTSSSNNSSSSQSQPVNYADVDALLNGSNLTDDEKAAIRSVYGAVAEGDQAAAQKMVANLQLAKAYADPMLARQLTLVTDELSRTAQGMDQDLDYQETTLQNRLKDLQEDVAFNKETLSLDLQQELKDLETYLGTKLQETRDTMAARGFTQSSRRQKKEGLLQEQVGGLRETTERRFGVQMRNLDETQGRSERDTALELERLRNLSERGKVDLFRQGESTIGTEGVKGLSEFSGMQTLGDKTGEDIVGSAQLDYQDSLSNFV